MSPPLLHVMSYNTRSRSMRVLALTLGTLCAGCQSLEQGFGSGHESPLVRRGFKQVAAAGEKEVSPGDPTQDVWARLGQEFTMMNTVGANPRVEQQRVWLMKNPTFLSSASVRASRYIHFIAQRLEARRMPAELALLPIVESGYNPMANSNREAVGLWQFIPSTGRDFNLRQTKWYDGRRDILASSNAAMDYLTRLHKQFDGDWLLALAAYNAGEGRVGRAVKWNKDRGLPIDFWHLRLPQETRDYVPRLLALSVLVQAPQAHGVNLKPVANVPYFDVVQLNRPVDLATFAADTGIDESELLGLNPAFLKKQMMDGPAHLLVPRAQAQAQTLSASLSKKHNANLAIKSVTPEQISQPVVADQQPQARTEPVSAPFENQPVATAEPSTVRTQPAEPKRGKPVVVYSDRKAPDTTLPRAFVPRSWL